MHKLTALQSFEVMSWLDRNRKAVGRMSVESALARINQELDFQVLEPQLRWRCAELNIAFAPKLRAGSQSAKIESAFIVLVKALEREGFFKTEADALLSDIRNALTSSTRES